VKVFVAAEKCQGHARCYAVAPDVFELDDDGYNQTAEADISPEQEAQARLGVESCPEGAITLAD
jgi:ferredoxin